MPTKKLKVERRSPKSLHGMQEKRFCHSILLEYNELADLRFNGCYKSSSEILNLFLIGRQIIYRLIEKNKLCKDGYTKSFMIESFASKPGGECINLHPTGNLYKTGKYSKDSYFYNNKESPKMLVLQSFFIIQNENLHNLNEEILT